MTYNPSNNAHAIYQAGVLVGNEPDETCCGEQFVNDDEVCVICFKDAYRNAVEEDEVEIFEDPAFASEEPYKLDAKDFTEETRVSIAVRTDTYITVPFSERPRCVGCNFTDGCIDDENGAVDTVWTRTEHGWMCRSCVGVAAHKYFVWMGRLAERSPNSAIPAYEAAF